MRERTDAVIDKLVTKQEALNLPRLNSHSLSRPRKIFRDFAQTTYIDDIRQRVEKERLCLNPYDLKDYFRGLTFEKMCLFVLPAQKPQNIILSSERTLRLWHHLHPEARVRPNPLGQNSLYIGKQGLWVPDGIEVVRNGGQNWKVVNILEYTLCHERNYYISKLAHMLRARSQFLKDSNLENFILSGYNFIVPQRKSAQQEIKTLLPKRHRNTAAITTMPFNKDQFAGFIEDIINDNPIFKNKFHPKFRTTHYLS